MALLALGGCGTGFVYNRLDWVLHYYLANQVTLDGQQSRELRENLAGFLAWHRRSELPRYAAFLDRFAAAAAQPIEPAQLESVRSEIEQFVRDAVRHGAPDAARWLTALRPAQVDELFGSFAADERKQRAKHCDDTPAERLAAGTDHFVDKFEDWTGRLRSSQRALVAARLATIEGDACTDVDSQERSRAAFRALVDQGRAQPDFARRLGDFLARPEDRWDADYRRVFEANRARYLGLFADLDRSLSPKQRAHAVARLHEVASDLRDLAAD